MFNFWDWEKDRVLEGMFKGRAQGIGKFKRDILLIELKDGRIAHTWIYASLLSYLYGLPFGARIKLTYKGLESMPDKPNNKFKAFDFELLELPDVKK